MIVFNKRLLIFSLLATVLASAFVPVLLHAKAANEADEEIVDFGLEEEASAAESAAIQKAAIFGAVVKVEAEPAETDDDDDDGEEEVDFGAEEEAADAESAKIQLQAGAVLGDLGKSKGQDKNMTAAQVKQAKDLAYWRNQPYPELEYSGWMAVGPMLALLWMAFQVPQRKKKK